MSVRLRPAQDSDLETLISLWLELVDYNISTGQRRPLSWSRPNDFARKTVIDALAQPENNHVVVAVNEDAGTIVGFCHAQLINEPEPCPGHVNTLIVKAGHRGQGIEQLLLDDAMTSCRDSGANEVSLHVAAAAS